MSRSSITVRYDGPGLSDHKMPVDELAPSLLALSALCKKLNQKHNGPGATARLYVDVDSEQHCAQFVLELVQHVTAVAQSVIALKDAAATAHDIYEWLGIASGGALGLIGLMKLLAGKPPGTTQLTVRDSKQVTQMVFNGNTYFVHPEAMELLRDKDALKRVDAVVTPAKTADITSIEFEENGRVVERVTASDARNIEATSEFDIQDPQKPNITNIPHVRVKVKTLDILADSKWKVIWDRTIDVKIEDKAWLGRLHANEVIIKSGASLDVAMRIEVTLDKNNEPIGDAAYFVTEVHDVIDPPEQDDLFS